MAAPASTDPRPPGRLRARLDRWLAGQRAGLLWRLVSDSAWEHRRAYAAALALMGVVAAMGGAVALTVERVTDEVFFEQNADSLVPVAGLIAGVFVIRGLAMWGQAVLLARIGNRIVAGLQRRLHAHVLSQGLAYHAQTDGGALATAMTHGAAAARQVLQLLATRLGVDLMSVLVLLGVMVYQDWRLSLVALVGLPAALGGVAWLVGHVRRQARAEVALNADILAGIQETVAGARVIRAFGLERRFGDRMGGAIDGVRVRADRIAWLQGMVNPLMETAAGIAAAAVILYGGWRVIHDGLAVGTFFGFLTALMMAGDPARRLAQLSVSIRRHIAGVEFLYAAFDRAHPLAVPEGAPPMRRAGGEVAFRDVVFTYPGAETPALRGLTFTAPAGQVTALVGLSGSGKSTVLSLIERFFDPDAGRIEIDGQDIRSVDPASLRARLALVGQDTVLFDLCAADNIRLGREGASDAEVVAAARAARADGFLRALPKGYATRLGEGGATLSGGQRQRLALARALLRAPDILLLDEATAALDAETGAQVQAALDRAAEGRTVIVVAHALATVRRADQILVVEDGVVVETGSHDTLMQAGGRYARLAALQFTEEERA